MYPNYVYFSEKFNWGNPIVIRNALNFVWSFIERNIGKRDVENNLDNLIDKCKEITPDTHDFNTVYVSSALDAASATIILLHLLKSGSAELVIDIASLCIDTVDMYVQELEGMNPKDPDLEFKILSHPMMQRELEQQSEDIKLLNIIDFSYDIDLKRLKKRINTGSSFMGFWERERGMGSDLD